MYFCFDRLCDKRKKKKNRTLEHHMPLGSRAQLGEPEIGTPLAIAA
jgi:hypothetical protein